MRVYIAGFLIGEELILSALVTSAITDLCERKERGREERERGRYKRVRNGWTRYVYSRLGYLYGC